MSEVYSAAARAATDQRPLPERLRDVVFFADRLKRLERIERQFPRLSRPDGMTRGLWLIRKAKFDCYLTLKELGAVPPSWLDEDARPAGLLGGGGSVA